MCHVTPLLHQCHTIINCHSYITVDIHLPLVKALHCIYFKLCLRTPLVKKTKPRIKYIDTLAISHPCSPLCKLIIEYMNVVPRYMYPYFLFAAIHHLKSSPTFSVRSCSSVGRVTVDLIRRSWVRFPPRSKDFFFASCGSLFSFTRANAQWVIHGFK